MKSEFDLIKQLRGKIPLLLQGSIGIGDDAGVLSTKNGESWLFSTDTIVEGVDFTRSTRPQLVGRKALAVNLSDIAAMGGEPVAFVIALGIPRNLKENWLLKFYDGMMSLAKNEKVLCLGGDISRAREFFASVAILGRCKKSELVTRSGAKAGDWIGVTGKLGGSILGHHLNFKPRLEEARFLGARFKPSAMIDISDGLLQDLGRILEMSRKSAVVHLDQIPVSKDALQTSRLHKHPPLDCALTDGEDFELLFTVSTQKKSRLQKIWSRRFPAVRLSWIGKIGPAGKEKIGLFQKGRKISMTRYKRKGFSHF